MSADSSPSGLGSWAIAGLVVASLFVVAALAVFMFGQDLFGSDPGAIDDYNREVLESCDLPEDSTLVRTYVSTVVDGAELRFRTMSFIWALPRSADEVAAFYGVPRAGIWATVSDRRACRFDQHPLSLMLDRWMDGAAPMDVSTQTAGPGDAATREFWAPEGAEITDLAEVPDSTRSFVLLRLGQREVDGVFGMVVSR